MGSFSVLAGFPKIAFSKCYFSHSNSRKVPPGGPYTTAVGKTLKFGECKSKISI